MPVYQDKKTSTWFVKCYYTDYTGAKRPKNKVLWTNQTECSRSSTRKLKLVKIDVYR